LTDYSALLEVYTIEEILELNDITPEELLIFLHEERFIKLPKTKALEFD